MQWWLLVAAVSLLTLTASGNKWCDEEDGVKLLPGYKMLLNGVDIAFINLQGSSPPLTKNRIFKLSCIDGRPATIKSNGKSIKYLRPDQLISYDEVNSQEFKTTSEHIKTVKDLSRNNQKGINVGGGYGPVTGALNSENKKMLATLQKGETTLNRMEKTDKTLTMSIGPSPPVNEDFIDEVKRLPDTYEAGKDDYLNFINLYGTHFIYKAMFGGMAVQQSETSNEYFETHTEEQFSAGMKLKFMEYVEIAPKYSNSQKKDLKELNDKTEYHTYTRGGKSVNIIPPGFIEEWQKTVKTNPAMLVAHFSEIASLIDKDPIKDENKADQMRKAVRIYLEEIYYTKTIGIVEDKMLKDGSNEKLKNLKDLLRKSQNATTGRIAIQKAQQMLEDIDFSKKQAINKEWKIKVVTCDKWKAGTNDDFDVNILGTKDGHETQTGLFKIPDGPGVNRTSHSSSSSCKNRLERGCFDEFSFTPSNMHIGDITAVTFKGYGKGFGSDWDLCEVIVTHGNKQFKWSGEAEIDKNHKELALTEV